jgi:phosphatidate cytidylyltransferase
MSTALANPAASPLFLPTLTTLGGLLGVAFTLLCLVERRHLSELRRRVLFRRWLSWLVIGPLYALAILGGPATAALLVGLLTAQGLREYARLVGLPRLYSQALLVAGLLAVGGAAWSSETLLALPPLLLLAGTLVPLLTRDARSGTRHLAFAALGFAYIPWLLSHLLLIHREVADGPSILLGVGLAVALSDVGAFTAGRLFGRHQLAPALSPNKTWAGVVGNVLGAYVGFGLLQIALPEADRPLLLATLPLVVALGAVWGDLLESLMKRESGVKDAGTWLPGMGGILDRIDSLIVTAPLVYYALRAVA